MAAGISIALLAVLAAGSLYLAELSQRLGQGPQTRKLTHEPDFFVENFALTRLDAQGAPVFRLSAERLVHYPDDDSTEYRKPQLVSLDPEKPTVTLHADRGRADKGGKLTELFDNVRLTRASAADRPALRVLTDYVMLLSDEDVARTDRPVRIEFGQSVLTGVGMDFYNADRRLEIRSAVQGTWNEPPR